MSAESDDGGAESSDAVSAIAVRGNDRRRRCRRHKFRFGAAALCALVAAVVSVAVPQPQMADGAQLYTNTFAVKLHGDGLHVDEAIAHRVAKRAGSGFENIGKVYTYYYARIILVYTARIFFYTVRFLFSVRTVLCFFPEKCEIGFLSKVRRDVHYSFKITVFVKDGNACT